MRVRRDSFDFARTRFCETSNGCIERERMHILLLVNCATCRFATEMDWKELFFLFAVYEGSFSLYFLFNQFVSKQAFILVKVYGKTGSDIKYAPQLHFIIIFMRISLNTSFYYHLTIHIIDAEESFSIHNSYTGTNRKTSPRVYTLRLETTFFTPSRIIHAHSTKRL